MAPIRASKIGTTAFPKSATINHQNFPQPLPSPAIHQQYLSGVLPPLWFASIPYLFSAFADDEFEDTTNRGDERFQFFAGCSELA
jgi:hypothetical protein